MSQPTSMTDDDCEQALKGLLGSLSDEDIRELADMAQTMQEEGDGTDVQV